MFLRPQAGPAEGVWELRAACIEQMVLADALGVAEVTEVSVLSPLSSRRMAHSLLKRIKTYFLCLKLLTTGSASPPADLGGKAWGCWSAA